MFIRVMILNIQLQVEKSFDLFVCVFIKNKLNYKLICPIVCLKTTNEKPHKGNKYFRKMFIINYQIILHSVSNYRNNRIQVFLSIIKM